MMHQVLLPVFGVQVCRQSTSLQLGCDLGHAGAHARVPEGTVSCDCGICE
jgi:hypothetical protein